jgi:hypothetical protein
MHPRTIWAIVRKDALDLLLNRSALGGLLFPIILSLMWLHIINVIGNRTIDILVYNSGRSNVVQVVEAAVPSPEVTQASSAEEVGSAFGPTPARKTTPYAVGLIVPADLDSSLRAGTHPQLQLYLNGNTVNAQTEALIQAAIVNYGRALANVQPPLGLTTTVQNPPSETNAAVELRGVYVPLALLLSLVVGTTFVPRLLIEEKEKKTLRMLMVTPASFEDVLIGKLLLVLLYQLVLTAVALAILGAFTGRIALVLTLRTARRLLQPGTGPALRRCVQYDERRRGGRRPGHHHLHRRRPFRRPVGPTAEQQPGAMDRQSLADVPYPSRRVQCLAETGIVRQQHTRCRCDPGQHHCVACCVRLGAAPPVGGSSSNIARSYTSWRCNNRLKLAASFALRICSHFARNPLGKKRVLTPTRRRSLP